jgi:hypothetical protein
LGQYKFEKVAEGIPRDKLFQWFTDFSPEDPAISKRRGVDTLLSRQVTREGNKLRVENQVLSRGKSSRFDLEITLHPEDYTYDVKGTTPGMNSNMRFSFTEIPGVGARVTVECNYELLSTELETRDASGLVNKELKEGQERLVSAFLAEAQEQLSIPAKSP